MTAASAADAPVLSMLQNLAIVDEMQFLDITKAMGLAFIQ